MLKNKITLFFLAVATALFGQEKMDWQLIELKAEKHIVLIEYLEVRTSRESISKFDRVKRVINGVVVDSSGLIMTSSSIFAAQLDISGGNTISGVTRPPEDIKIRFKDNSFETAQFIGKDDDKKVAFIKVNNLKGLKAVHFKDNLALNIGEPVMISYRTNADAGKQMALIPRPINSSEKGPNSKIMFEKAGLEVPFALVFNAKGQAIGFTAQQPRYYGRFGYESWIFAEIIRPEKFKNLIKNPPKYKKKKTSRKHWLGIKMQPFTRAFARYYKQSALKGILINTVYEGSPAFKAGLKTGDIITEFNGSKIEAETYNDLTALRQLIRGAEDALCHMRFWRNGKVRKVQLTLTEAPISQFLAEEVSNNYLGFNAKQLTQDIIRSKRLEFDTDGVWISQVENAGLADLAGLRAGDLLLKVNDQSLKTVEQLKGLLKKAEDDQVKYISLFVRRFNETRFLFIKTHLN